MSTLIAGANMILVAQRRRDRRRDSVRDLVVVTRSATARCLGERLCGSHVHWCDMIWWTSCRDEEEKENRSWVIDHLRFYHPSYPEMRRWRCVVSATSGAKAAYWYVFVDFVDILLP